MRRGLPVFGGLILGLGLGIIIFFGFYKPEEVPFQNDPLQGMEALSDPSVDNPAPDFKLNSLSGNQIQLKDYRGQIVLLNFWATWCAPCRLEMPVLQNRAEQFVGEFAVVAINNAENSTDVQAYIDELGLSFEVLLDPEAEVQHLYMVRGYPTTYILDAEGLIRVKHIGLLTEEQLDGYLHDLGLMPK